MDDQKVIAEFTTNGFFIDPIAGIILATFVGMTAMFTVIMIGAGIFVSMAALLLGILAVYGKVSGNAYYVLTEKGIGRRIKPFIAQFIKAATKEQFFTFEQMKSYRSETDLGRGFQQIQSLKIELKISPNRLWLNDQKNKDGFEVFRDAFIAVVKERQKNRESTSSSTQSATSDHPNTEKRNAKTLDNNQFTLKEKKGFYETAFAKVLTVFFIFLTILLLYLFVIGTLGKATHLFRLFAIIVPGTFYMVYRVFVKKKTNEES